MSTDWASACVSARPWGGNGKKIGTEESVLSRPEGMMKGATPSRWEVTIPGWCPTPLGRLSRDVGSPTRWERRDRDYVRMFARLARIPPAVGRRRLSFAITLPTGHRRWDGAAFHKGLLQACVHAGLLKDDSPRWCEVGTVACARGDALETVLIIEALS